LPTNKEWRKISIRCSFPQIAKELGDKVALENYTKETTWPNKAEMRQCNAG